MFNEVFNAVDNFVNGNQVVPSIDGAVLTQDSHGDDYTSKFVVIKRPSWSTVDIQHIKHNYGRDNTVTYTITKEEAAELAKFFNTIAKYLG